MGDQSAVTVETLKAIAAAFNAHDLNAIMEFFVDDCTLEMPRGPEPWDSASRARLRCAMGWYRASRASRTSTTVMTDTGSVATSACPSGC